MVLVVGPLLHATATHSKMRETQARRKVQLEGLLCVGIYIVYIYGQRLGLSRLCVFR
jgi:hypothetical protein